jgi:hypothetical protein
VTGPPLYVNIAPRNRQKAEGDLMPTKSGETKNGLRDRKIHHA